MIKFNKNQIESLENVKNREELCEKIYAYILSHKDSFKERGGSGNLNNTYK